MATRMLDNTTHPEFPLCGRALWRQAFNLNQTHTKKELWAEMLCQCDPHILSRGRENIECNESQCARCPCLERSLFISTTTIVILKIRENLSYVISDTLKRGDLTTYWLRVRKTSWLFCFQDHHPTWSYLAHRWAPLRHQVVFHEECLTLLANVAPGTQ